MNILTKIRELEKEKDPIVLNASISGNWIIKKLKNYNSKKLKNNVKNCK